MICNGIIYEEEEKYLSLFMFSYSALFISFWQNVDNLNVVETPFRISKKH